jgi:hypothetical protein
MSTHLEFLPDDVRWRVPKAFSLEHASARRSAIITE